MIQSGIHPSNDLPRAAPAAAAHEAREEIRRLVALATKEGNPDRYAGKRKKGRLKGKLWMDLRWAKGNLEPIQICTRDISIGGVGFWLRKRVEVGDVVYVRDGSDGMPHPWLRIRVSHCVNGFKGYMVGGEFADA